MIRPRDDLQPLSSTEQDLQSAPGQQRDMGRAGAVVRWAGSPEGLPPELEFFRTSEAYQVELEAFQGPLDLLLYLIQKDRIDIYDIPIASITDQFLQYLEIIQILSLDNAADFLVMAATLLRIKTRMLLPVTPEEELDDEDPRADLVRRLLEYKRFKEAAAVLQRHEQQRRLYHVRTARYPFLDQLNLEPPLRIELFDLLSALARVFDRLKTTPVHTVRREVFTVEQKIILIRERLGQVSSLRFEEFFRDDAIKMEVVVTFIAVLELVKRGELVFLQTQLDGPIWLQMAGVSRDGNAPAPAGGQIEAEAQA